MLGVATMSDTLTLERITELQTCWSDKGQGWVPMTGEEQLQALVLARRWLEQPVIAGKIEALARDFTSPSRATELAGYIATREQTAYQRGRESAQGGWVAAARYVCEIHGNWAYGTADTSSLSSAVMALERVLPPPPSDTSKGGGT